MFQKVIQKVILFILCSGVFFTLKAAEQFYLVKDQQPSAVIVISADALDPVEEAAKILQSYVYKISGTQLKIVTDSDDIKAPKILIGESKYTRSLGYANDKFSDQEYMIKTIANNLLLMGRDENNDAVKKIRGNTFCSKKYFQQIGSLYAVNTFLEKYCGVRWYMPTELGEVVPQTKTLVVAAINLRRTPSTNFRTMFAYWHVPKKLWIWKYTKTNKPEPPYLSDDKMLAWGRQLKMGGEALAVNHGQCDYCARFGTSHPEWFANHEAQSGNQLCYSNPEVLQQVVTDARNFYDGKYVGHWHIGNYFSVMPNDTKNWCMCEKCAAQYDQSKESGFHNGYASNYVWGFVCKVAREVAKTHPKAMIGCASYWEYAEVPTGIDFPNNVVVEICKSHSNFYDATKKEEVYKKIEAWSKITKNIFFWDYYLFPEFHSYDRFPAITPHLIADDIAYMKHLGLHKGMMCQMDEYYLKNLPLDHIRIYVTMKLLDDWDRNVDDILEEYYRLFYGPAAQPMKKFWGSLEQIYLSARNTDSKYTSADYDWMVLCPPAKVAELGKTMDDAQKLAPVGSVYAKRVQLIRDAVYQAVIVGNSDHVLECMKNIKQLYCPRVAKAPVIDGVLQEASWQKAGSAVDWKSIRGDIPGVPTETKVMYDKNNLYITFICSDEKGYKVRQNCTAHDGQVYLDDSVEIFIDVNHKIKENYFHIVANTVPTIYDADKTKGASWNSEAKIAVVVNDGQWMAEMAIPLKALGVNKISAGSVWGMNFCRNRRGLPGFVSPFTNWSGPNGYHNTGRFGLITFQ
ncbi:MAG: DUF4838 domain-containing protein [Lentisphaeria bacterium]